MRRFIFLLAIALGIVAFQQSSWATQVSCNRVLSGKAPFMQSLDPVVRVTIESLNSTSSERARRVVETLSRFGFKNRTLLIAAALNSDSSNDVIQNRYGAKVSKILAELHDAGTEPLNRALPQLSNSNPDAAIIEVAKTAVDVEDAIVAVSEGKTKALREYRKVFASTKKVKLLSGENGDHLWRYLTDLCEHNVPTAAFRLGDVYIDYPFEDVKFHYVFNSGKIFRKFYGEPETETSSSSKLFDDARMAGKLISKADYDSP